jgi:hypothetical protein
MDESIKYCDQCGEKSNGSAKFCSSCGQVLKGSTKQAFDANIRVSTYNEITAKVLEGAGKGTSILSFFLKKLFKLAIILLAVGAVIYGITYIGFEIHESSLKKDRDRVQKALNELIAAEKERARSTPVLLANKWAIIGQTDPASGKNIGRYTRVKSNIYDCFMSVERRINGTQLTSFKCTNFSFPHRESFLNFKFDKDSQLYRMKSFRFSSEQYSLVNEEIYIKPAVVKNKIILQCYFDCVDDAKYENNISYNEFINKIITNNTIAIEMTPTIDHEYCDYNNPLSGRDRDEPYCLQSAPIWIKFSLKESKEAIEKLGREL